MSNISVDLTGKSRTHYSINSHLSLTLPASWKEIPTRHAAAYVDQVETLPQPSLAVKIWRSPVADAQAYRQVVAGALENSSLNFSQSELLDVQVDNFPALLHRCTWTGPHTSYEISQLQYYFQPLDLIYCIVSTVEAKLMPHYQPIIEAVVASTRWIPFNNQE